MISLFYLPYLLVLKKPKFFKNWMLYKFKYNIITNIKNIFKRHTNIVIKKKLRKCMETSSIPKVNSYLYSITRIKMYVSIVSTLRSS